VSTLESIFWHVLGYSAIPLILLAGIVVSSLIFYGLLKLFDSRGDDS
jgi:uncharacterized protein (TIGR02808 family)